MRKVSSKSVALCLALLATQGIGCACEENDYSLEPADIDAEVLGCVRYVDSLASGERDGLSWQTAFEYIDDAVKAVKEIEETEGREACEIVVAEHQMIEDVEFADGVAEIDDITVRRGSLEAPLASEGCTSFRSSKEQGLLSRSLLSRGLDNKNGIEIDTGYGGREGKETMNEPTGLYQEIEEAPDDVFDNAVVRATGSFTDWVNITGYQPWLQLNETNYDEFYRLEANNGDIFLSDVDNSTNVFYWDSSAQNLGFGKAPSLGYEVGKNFRITEWGNTEFAYYTGTNNSNFMTYGTTGKHVFRTYNGTDHVNRGAWDGSGNLGVGTDAPAERLHVEDSDDAFVEIESGNGKVAGIFLVENNNFKWKIVNDGDYGDRLLFQTYALPGNTRMTIDQDGNVGIGTTTPDNKLDVKGTIRCEELIVDTGWSDYVFEDDYYLMPIEEISLYIKEHGALPGVPTAKEVKEEGVSIGESQSVLLKKIEELTLYLIRQNQKIVEMQEEIDKLMKQDSRKE